jgi:hypothetical protein
MAICGKRTVSRFVARAGPKAGQMVSIPCRCNQPKGHRGLHLYSATPRRARGAA